MKNILILGGDGYLGWPTAMHFSTLGFNVVVADNYFRRNLCTSLDTGMLYNVPTLTQRANIWQELTGKRIEVVITDLTDPKNMRALFNGSAETQYPRNSLLKDQHFDAVVHYAEQPSAPYSVMNFESADQTLTNNLRVTNNLMWAIHDLSPDTHIVKLGTMGEYGTPNIDIEEGWLDIEHNGRSGKFLFPRQASSIYHTSKIMDTDLLWWAVRTWDLRVTDLMQGPVYGLSTAETDMDDRLGTIFNYDEIFGTIVNRFVVQSVVGHPLTVYGSGTQTRGYLHIRDTMQCVEKAVGEPAAAGELRIFNQIMETFSVSELAEQIAKVGISRGHNVEVKPIENPRKEAESHYYNPTYQSLLDLGVKPHYLTEQTIGHMFEVVEKHKENIRKDVIFNGVKWG